MTNVPYNQTCLQTRNTSTAPHGQRLNAVACIATILFLLWGCYTLNGFRMWWVPIKLSDEDAGSAIRQLLFAGSAAISLILLFIKGQLWQTARAQWRLAMLASWIALSTLYSDLPTLTVKRSVLLICGFITACTVIHFSAQPLRRAHTLLIAVTSAAAWVSLAWWAAFAPEITTNPARPGLAGISNHPNTLAPALVIGLVLSVAWKPGRQGFYLLRGLCLIGCAAALAMTTSVTSIVVAVVAIAIYIPLVLPAYWKAATALLAAAIATAVITLGPARMATWLLGSVGRDASMSGRDELWNAVLAKIPNSPIFGHGWGAFWTQGKGRELVTTWNPRQSHNAYIDVALDLGLLGIAAFALVLIPTLWHLWKGVFSATNAAVRRQNAALWALLVSLLSVYALQQSFLGKVDAFAFVAVLLICAAAAQEHARNNTRKSI